MPSRAAAADGATDVPRGAALAHDRGRPALSTRLALTGRAALVGLSLLLLATAPSVQAPSAQELAAKGTELLQRGLAPPAAELLRQAVALAPERGELRVLLGVALHQSGRPDLALPELEEGARLLPEVADAHYNLGLSFAALDRFADAERAFGRALELAPDNVDARYNHGHALLAAGHLAEAQHELEKVVAASPGAGENALTRADAHYLLGRIALESRRSADSLVQARRHLDAALAMAPMHARALAQKGVLELEEGRADAALPLLDQALALAPEDPLSRWQRTRALMKLGRKEEARAELARFQQIEHVVRATERLRRLLASAPADFGLRLRLAELLEQTGDRDEARKEVEQALRLRPDDAGAKALRARLRQ